jgi:membrane associated rhomboid family serine protease
MFWISWCFLVVFVVFYLLFPNGGRTTLKPFSSMRFFQQLEIEFQPYNFWDNQQLWVIVTAQLTHDGIGHCLNNVIFTIPLIEALHTYTLRVVPIESLALLLTVCLPIFLGICGFLTSWSVAQHQHGEIAKFSSTVGFSPAMYGLGFFLAVVDDDQLVPTLDFGGTIHLNSALLLLAFTFFPYLVSSFKPSAAPNTSVHRFHFLVTTIALLGLFLFVIPANAMPPIFPSTWMAAYLLKNFLFDLYWQFGIRGGFNSADHACHLGGAIAGLLLGWCFLILFHEFRLEVIFHLLPSCLLLMARSLFSHWIASSAAKSE